MSRGYRKNGIPDRWLDYQPVGKRLPGSRFIAFKVPLKLALTRKLASSDVFGPWELLDTVKRDSQELGFIIDLTYTKRYYTPEDVPGSLQYVKIFTAGQEIPSDATILSFKRAVCRFLCENADNDKLIGVHCTHGLNRTGYLICRYLIDVDGLDPPKAIELFNSSRGHAIERQNYLDDLLSGPKRSNEGIEECDLKLVKGNSTHRPADSEANFNNMKERPGVSNDPSSQRRKNHCSHPPSRNQSLGLPLPLASGLLPLPGGSGSGLLPPPGGTGLLPSPPFSMTAAPFGFYRWSPPQANYQWRGPLPRAESRAPPPDSMGRSCSSYNQRGSRDNPIPSNQAPRASGQWANDSDTYTYGIPGKWDGPKMRTREEHNHRFYY
ncbi:RNA/RNP complex-1-interacting phosphatase isoform X2 [Boleophthalmus pectinirostris]|uniref:RNA/RNP complex-1-interacting phosphatase isoform X2 n=1 Tax=Boleophthalmus pectinirostris TaxID=150288 RepID=UPI000A1C6356|nr:RNA/RNP complex-1-interacting phosphatase isoform X2 [Boleophthalmus pectinirostris]